MRQTFLAVLLCLFSTTAAAAEDGYSLFLSTTGVTYHGYAVNDELAGQMPHKITKNGKWVLHPQEVGINLFVGSFHVNFTSLEDCFGEPAWVLAAGRHWHPTERLGLGLLGGIYVRKRHYFIDREGNLAFAADMPLTVQGSKTDYIPAPMVTASYLLLAEGHLRLALMVAGNFYLNHAVLALGYAF